MLKHVAVYAALVLLAAVPATAQASLGVRDVGLNSSFNVGATEFHNSIGMSVGAHVPLFRIGPFRLPTIGGDALLASKCPEWAYDDSQCKATLNLQIASGIDVILKTYRDSSEQITSQHAFSVQLARVVVGSLRGEEGWAVKIGYTVYY